MRYDKHVFVTAGDGAPSSPVRWGPLRKVYCLGDSISAEPYTSAGSALLSWVWHAAALLPGVTVVPVAVSGRRVETWTAALTDALIRDTADPSGANAVIIALGVNNLTGAPVENAATIEDRLALLAGRLIDYGIGPVIGTSITPIAFSGAVEQDRLDINDWIMALGNGAFNDACDFATAVAKNGDASLWDPSLVENPTDLHPDDAGQAFLGNYAGQWFLDRLFSPEVHG